MSDKDYSPHESWCDTQNKISDRCNCMVGGYIEKIEDALNLIEALEEKLRVAIDVIKQTECKCHHNFNTATQFTCVRCEALEKLGEDEDPTPYCTVCGSSYLIARCGII